MRHYKLGEPACPACLAAANETKKLRRAAQPDHMRSVEKAWRGSNPDRIREYSRTRRLKDLDAVRRSGRERSARWREADPERSREVARRRSRSWKKANRQKANAWERARHARKLGAPTIPFTVDQLNVRLSMWGNRCWMCEAPATTVDHVKPLAAGGWHCLSNLRPACRSCNSRKRQSWPLK